MAPTSYSLAGDFFYFLDLLKEIRSTVYEQLSIITRPSTNCIRYTPKYKCSTTLVLRLLSLSILKVCKMIEILAHPLQVIIPSTDLSYIGDGFARFLRIREVTSTLPGPATIQSDAITLVQVSPVWAAALRVGSIPAVANLSLVQ
jgi:hypothetical protein